MAGTRTTIHRDELIRRAWTELGPEIAAQGFELIEVEIGQQGATPILRLYIDREGGVTLDHCAEVSRFISRYLDVIEFLDDRYSLEVSSPGIDRPLRKPGDFERFVGESVKLRTVAPVDGRKRFKGTLQGIADGMITVETDGHSVHIHLENIQKAQLDR
jgi:ribosome maturation factor RimP